METKIDNTKRNKNMLDVTKYLHDLVGGALDAVGECWGVVPPSRKPLRQKPEISLKIALGWKVIVTLKRLQKGKIKTLV